MQHIKISITNQTLQILEGENLLYQYPISSAQNGTGFEDGSFCTPTGNFIIAEKFGHDAPIFTNFKARKPINIWNPEETSTADLITTRILWLHGTDPQNANTKERYIYIHGTNHEDKIGTPASCGCIRMNNQDIIDLFDQTPINTPLTIQ